MQGSQRLNIALGACKRTSTRKKSHVNWLRSTVRSSICFSNAFEPPSEPVTMPAL